MICNLAALVSLVIGLILYARFAIRLLICKLMNAHPNHTILAKIARDGILSPVVVYTSIRNTICTKKISILIAIIMAILVMTKRRILLIMRKDYVNFVWYDDWGVFCKQMHIVFARL